MRKRARVITLEKAITLAKQYPSRAELFRKDPSLYKWFRQHYHMDELEKIQPRKNVFRTLDECVELLKSKEWKNRYEFRNTHPSAYDRLRASRREALEKYLPPSQSEQVWTKEAVLQKLASLKRWRDYRKDTSFMNYVKTHGSGEAWYQRWLQIKLKRGKKNARNRKRKSSRKTGNKRSAHGKRNRSGHRKGATQKNKVGPELSA